MHSIRALLACSTLAGVLALPSLAAAQNGGPDASGTIYTPTVYDFVPLATTSGATLHTMGDDTVTPLNIPVLTGWTGFSWYGVSRTTLIIDSNGKLNFNPAATSTYTNTCIPGTAVGAGAQPDLAPLWDDLNASLGGGIYSYYDAGLDRLIVSWENIQHFGASDPVSFQVQLWGTGEVEFHWADVNFGDPIENGGANATVGVQDFVGATHSAGNVLQRSCNTNVLVDGTATVFAVCTDGDGDGSFSPTCGGDDCDDTNGTVNPSAPEACDGLDTDCDPATSEAADGDGDGQDACSGDCDDTDSANFTGNVEICDLQDNDCDAVADGAFDLDSDGASTCGGDCDDGDPAILPGATEACDGVDQNCDGSLVTLDDVPAPNLAGTSANLLRGTYWSVTTAATLDTIQAFIDAPTGAGVTFGVFSAASASGPWTAIATDTVTTTLPPGSRWHTSPQFNLALSPGTFYAMVAAWNGPTIGYNWVNGASLPAPASFGSLLGGVAGSGSAFTITTSTSLYAVRVTTNAETDSDGDGFFACVDCDDSDNAVFSGAAEVCDGSDNDCDGVLFVGEDDVDGDGDFVCADDCDDNDAATYGGAPESCDGIDNDCDGNVPGDESSDGDGDGALTCEDCDDSDPALFPGAVETCDGIDENCDGVFVTVDNVPTPATFGASTDLRRGTVWTVANATVLDSIQAFLSPPTGTNLTWTVFEAPTATGPFTVVTSVVAPSTLPVGNAWHSSPQISVPFTAGLSYAITVSWVGPSVGYAWASGALPPPASFGSLVGGVFGAGSTATLSTTTTLYSVRPLTGSEADNDGDGYLACLDDCDDADAVVNPGNPEVCDGADNDCDGVLFPDEDDVDGDGALACFDDCDDLDATTYVGAPEVCDTLDNDCDGNLPADELDDGDGDGSVACEDCDDGNGGLAPGLPELCDGFDQDCDGLAVFGGGLPDPAPAATSNATGGPWWRGNVYSVSTPTVLDHIGWELGVPVGTTLTFRVYQGASISGPWNTIATSTLTTTLTGQGQHESPPMAVPFAAGQFYAVVIHWAASASWYGWTSAPGFPLAQSFGAIAGGLGDTVLPSGSGLTLGTLPNSYPVTIYTGLPEADGDGDGFLACAECDDGEVAINPGEAEVCGNAIDENCDGVVGLGADSDGDGVSDCDGDCDETESTVYPGAPELCDGLDNDCDLVVPPGEVDADNDGSPLCLDCDDGDANSAPGFVETCDGDDNDCNGVLPTNEIDGDGDGVAPCAGDCLDGNPAIPQASEACDGLDTDCNGNIPVTEGDVDGDGFSSCEGDCDDGEVTSFPGGTEDCDGLDNDCDGALGLGEVDNDVDGVLLCGGDCDDDDDTTYAGAPELCDGVDNDCDGNIAGDELTDGDGDGLSPCDGDCDDTEVTVLPGATEVCDGFDTDCDGALPGDEVDEDEDDALLCAGDCDDAEPLAFPGGDEAAACEDGIDNDCDDDIDDDDADCAGDDDDSADDDDATGDDDDATGDDDDSAGDDGDCDCEGSLADGGAPSLLVLIGLLGGFTTLRRRRAA